MDVSANRSRHVIVTGGSRGLGLAIVHGLLDAGYCVSTCSRSGSEDVTRLLMTVVDGRYFWQQAEIGKADSARGFVAAAMAHHRELPLYGLINNAGIAREGVLATFPDVAAAEVLQTNLLGAIQMARLATREMLARGDGGRIINISSIIGQRGYTGLAAYSASKAGMDGLTRALARELGRRRITVNSVAPGYLETEMSMTLGEGERGQIIRRTPLGRLGTSADVVPAILFLLGDGARFITGQTLTIDGGIIS